MPREAFGREIEDPGPTGLGAGPEPVAPESAARLDLARPRTAGEILSAALELYRRYWRGFLVMAFAIVGPIDLILYGLVGGYAWSDYDGAVSPLAGALLAFEPLVLTIPLVTAVHVRAVMSIGRGERPPVWGSVRAGWDDLPAVSWAVLFAIAGSALGFLAFILPGIWLAVSWEFAAQAVVVEGCRGTAALRRSFELVRGRWWRVFGIIFLLSLLAQAASALVSLPLDALARSVDSGALFTLSRIVGDTIAYSLIALAGTLLFFDLRARGPEPRRPSGSAPG
jgi:hypothetical protein